REDARGKVKAVAQVGNFAVSSGREVLDYPHIATQTIFPAAETSVVRAEIKNLAKKVGYIMGTGDEVAHSLEQIGCDVTMLSSQDLTRGDLSRFDAIVMGPRAFEVRPELLYSGSRFADYAANGGTLIMQYNQTAPNGNELTMGPVSFHISRERVTVEEAPV